MSNRYVPEIAELDGDDTRWALETANTLFAQGETREALRWIRRAAEAAAEAGQDDRALELAKSVSELRAQVDIPRTLPPPPAAATERIEIPPSPAVPAGALAASNGGAGGPGAPVAQVSGIQGVDAPPESTRAGGELLVTVVSSDGSLPARNASFVSHRAIRVAILPTSDSEETYRVRPLAAGEVAPEACSVGLLVAFDAGAAPLPGRKR